MKPFKLNSEGWEALAYNRKGINGDICGDCRADSCRYFNRLWEWRQFYPTVLVDECPYQSRLNELMGTYKHVIVSYCRELDEVFE